MLSGQIGWQHEWKATANKSLAICKLITMGDCETIFVSFKTIDACKLCPCMSVS